MPVKIAEDVFGTAVNPFTKKSETIRRFTLANDESKVSVQVITLGATITSLKVPDGCGIVDDVVLGYDDVAGYQTKSNPYFGSTVGRVCNRIGYGKFVLNGKEINVSKNFNNKHQLHGGFIGFDKAHWQVLNINEANGSLTMQHVSPDGHEGYPGEVTAKVEYKLTSDNCLHVHFEAVTTKTTAVNLTNHSYFNLAGHGAGSDELYEHLIKINADKLTVTDDDSIPTGELATVEGTPYDLRTVGNLGERLKKLTALGYDDNYCVNLIDGQRTTTVAKVYHPKSGRFMEVATDQPGVQFYTSNYLPEVNAPKEQQVLGKSGARYVKHGALCLETQKYPDAVNHKSFPSIILNPGETYVHEVIYKFGVCRKDEGSCDAGNYETTKF